MRTKGFILLENLIIFTLGILLLLACLRSYSVCLKTMHKKLLLEEALNVAERVQAQQQFYTTLQVQESTQVTAIPTLTIKEVQISYNEHIIFTLATAE